MTSGDHAYDVSAAFEILLEEVEAEIDFVNNAGAEAQTRRDYGRARDALARAEALTNFRDRLAEMRKEWLRMARAGGPQEHEAARAERRNLGKLRTGQRTPEKACCRPILKSLLRLGYPAEEIPASLRRAMEEVTVEGTVQFGRVVR